MSIHLCILLSEGGYHVGPVAGQVEQGWAGLGQQDRQPPPMSGVLDLMNAHKRLSLEGSPELRSCGNMSRPQTTTSRGP